MRSLPEISPEISSEYERATRWMNNTEKTLINKRDVSLVQNEFDVMRVNQFESQLMDERVMNIFLLGFNRIFKHFRSDVVSRWKPEMETLIQFLIFRYSIWKDEPTAGQKLQNMVYKSETHPLSGINFFQCISQLRLSLTSHSLLSSWRKIWTIWKNDPKKKQCLPKMQANSENPLSEPFSFDSGGICAYKLSTSQKLIYCFLTIGMNWGMKRLNEYMFDNSWSGYPEDDWHSICYRQFEKFKLFSQLLSLINLVVFLINGKYRTLIDRFLGIRLVYTHPKFPRMLIWDYMNQEKTLNGICDFIRFILPLINFNKIISIIKRAIPGGSVTVKGCPICKIDPILTPTVANCGHTFCYYCLSGSLLKESNFCCPSCNISIAEHKYPSYPGL